MDKKEEILQRVIEMFKLRKDFFIRNPVASIYHNGDYVIAFENYEIKLTQDEYEKIANRLFWGCGTCCGLGTTDERVEGEYVVVRGFPCMCHTGWWWSLTVRVPQ